LSIETGRDQRSILRAVPFILLGAVTLWVLATWFRREYNHDDFFFAYFSWLQTTDLVPFRDYFVPSFAVLPQLASPLFRIFGESFIPVDVARGAILLCIAALTVLVYLVSRALDSSRAWSALAALLWLCHPDVVLRMSDIRTDAIAALLLLASALAIMKATNERWAAAIAGTCFGLALVISIKTCLAAPFLLLGMVARTRRRSLLPLVLFCACAGAMLLADYAWNIHVYGLRTFIDVSRDFLSPVKGKHAHVTSGHALLFLYLSPVTGILFLTGLAGFRSSRRALTFSAMVIGYIALTMVVNPFLYPYNSLLFIPLLAPIASGTELLLRNRSKAFDGVALAGASVLVLSYGAMTMGTVTSRSNVAQRNVVRWIWQATTPGEHVFDWQGMPFGRPGIVHWWNYGGLELKYLDGWYSLESEIRTARVTLVIDNYRLHWMTPADTRFFNAHFVRFAPCLYAPGAFLPASSFSDGSGVFEIFVPGLYRVLTGTPVRIDGTLTSGTLQLASGFHRIAVSRPTNVALYYTTPRRERSRPPCPSDDDALIKGFD